MANEARANDRGPEGLLTLVCLTCGNEKFFADQVPDRVTCEKCGGTTFRNFFTPVEPDEATLSQLEETRRDVALDEASPETTPDDLRDLNNP
jgi:ribosomal protein S27AE